MIDVHTEQHNQNIDENSLLPLLQSRHLLANAVTTQFCTGKPFSQIIQNQFNKQYKIIDDTSEIHVFVDQLKQQRWFFFSFHLLYVCIVYTLITPELMHEPSPSIEPYIERDAINLPSEYFYLCINFTKIILIILH